MNVVSALEGYKQEPTIFLTPPTAIMTTPSSLGTSRKERKDPTKHKELPTGDDPLDDVPACLKVFQPQEFEFTQEVEKDGYDTNFKEAQQSAVAPPAAVHSHASTDPLQHEPNPQHATNARPRILCV